MSESINIFWFRRDLRLEDNSGLSEALASGKPVLPIFIFDTEILDRLEDRADKRVNFIYSAVKELKSQLEKKGSAIKVMYGAPVKVFTDIISNYKVDTVFTNHDYEPYAIDRDNKVNALLQKNSIGFKTFKDHVIFERLEVSKDDGKPYTVFTPYSKRWKSVLSEKDYRSWVTENNFWKTDPLPLISLEEMNFIPVDMQYPSDQLNEEILIKYHQQRDIPSIEGTSRMGVHLRFGTVGVRELVRRSMGKNETYLNELIWRDFYQMILANFPRVGQGLSFKPEYEAIPWRNNETEFQKWCKGETGYPIVDAGMRELNASGFMHNRVRMIVASFLTKHLLIDWKWGEAYFAQKLLDFDFASNNGGWQWAAGTGCDAAPYFRVFNPYLQTKKFDPQLKYVRKWVPEFESFEYPKPIVDHEFARKRCLEVYSKALKNN